MRTIYLVSFSLTCFLSFSSAQNLTDDIYFTPADADKDVSKVRVKADKPRYKNGAKEIIFKESSQGKSIVLDQDTVYFLSEMNDSIAMAETIDIDQEEGYYLNGFEGGEMEYEYAERIRRFHNPKFSIHISELYTTLMTSPSSVSIFTFSTTLKGLVPFILYDKFLSCLIAE